MRLEPNPHPLPGLKSPHAEVGSPLWCISHHTLLYCPHPATLSFLALDLSLSVTLSHSPVIFLLGAWNNHSLQWYPCCPPPPHSEPREAKRLVCSGAHLGLFHFWRALTWMVWVEAHTLWHGQGRWENGAFRGKGSQTWRWKGRMSGRRRGQQT